MIQFKSNFPESKRISLRIRDLSVFFNASAKSVFLRMLCGVSVILLWLCATQIVAAEDPCSDPECQDTWKFDSKVIYFPGYSTCPVTVLYQWRICDGKKVFNIYGLGWEYTAANCLSLTNSAFTPAPPGFPNFNPPAMLGYFHAAFEQLAKADFQSQYDALGINDKYLLQCPNNTKKYQLDWFYCISCCIYDATDPIHLTGSYYAIPHACGSSCCKIEMTICFDPVTNSMVTNTTRTILGPQGSCQFDPYVCDPYLILPDASINGTGVKQYQYTGYSTSCFQSCE